MTEITRGTENSRRITLSNINIVSGVRLYWQIYLQLDSTLSTEQRHSYRRKIIVITLHRFTPKNQVGPFDPSKVKNWYKKKLTRIIEASRLSWLDARGTYVFQAGWYALKVESPAGWLAVGQNDWSSLVPHVVLYTVRSNEPYDIRVLWTRQPPKFIRACDWRAT